MDSIGPQLFVACHSGLLLNLSKHMGKIFNCKQKNYTIEYCGLCMLWKANLSNLDGLRAKFISHVYQMLGWVIWELALNSHHFKMQIHAAI